ncbi:MAG TPA: hypothetical protein VGL58_17740 [Caulobacteraceae bacterium]|jgi:hypothetical protein
MGKVSVGAAIGASFSYLRSGWRGAWGILMITVWLAAILQAIKVLRPDLALVTALGAIISIFTATAASGALYRLTLQRNHPGDGAYAAHEAGLQWGGLEWRVLGANIIIGLILILIFLAACFIWGIALAASVGGHVADLGSVNSTDPAVRNAALMHLFLGPGLMASVILLVPAVCLLLFLFARFILFAPLAADGGGFDLGKAWALTRGAVLATIGALIVIGVAEVTLGAIAGFFAGMVGGLAGGSAGARLWGGIAGAAMGGAISPPLLAGLQLYLYRAHTANPAVAEAFS